MNLIDVFGYLATILVAGSFLMNSVLRLRVISLLGASIYAVYGFLIQAYPVVYLNTFIILANIYYIRKLYKSRTHKYKV